MTTSKRVKTTPVNMSAIGNSLIRYMNRGEGTRVEVNRTPIVGLKKFRFANQGADRSYTWESEGMLYDGLRLMISKLIGAWIGHDPEMHHPLERQGTSETATMNVSFAV